MIREWIFRYSAPSAILMNPNATNADCKSCMLALWAADYTALPLKMLPLK